MGRKLIARGGDSLAEAISNMANSGLDVVPSGAKREYAISDMPRMSAGMSETEDERDTYEQFLFKG